MLLFVFTLITMQTNFAMEQKKSSMSLTNLMNGRFDNGLLINKFSLSSRMDRQSQALNNQLQEWESNKNIIVKCNVGCHEEIKKVSLRKVGTDTVLLLVTQSQIEFYELLLKKNKNLLDRIEQNIDKTSSSLSKVNEDKNVLEKIKLAQREELAQQLLIKEGKKIVFNNGDMNIIIEIDIRQICEFIGTQNMIYLIRLINDFCRHPDEYFKRHGYYKRTAIERIFIPDWVPVPESVLRSGKTVITVVSGILSYFFVKLFAHGFLFVDSKIMGYSNDIVQCVFLRISNL
jgi:hypothetical protein